MNKNLLICLSMGVGLKFLPAQDVDFEVSYRDHSIYLQQGCFGMKYVKGEQSLPLSDLRIELSLYPESKEWRWQSSNPLPYKKRGFIW